MKVSEEEEEEESKYSIAFHARICSNDQTFELRLGELKANLIAREYHPKIIDDAFKRIREMSRSEALKKVEKVKTNREVLALTYHPSLPSVARTLRKHWEVMTNQSQFLMGIFPVPSMVAYERSKNLRDELFRAKVSTKRRTKRLLNGCTVVDLVSEVACFAGT